MSILWCISDLVGKPALSYDSRLCATVRRLALHPLSKKDTSVRRTRNRAALIALTAVTTASLVACGASETVTDEVVATTDGGTTYPLTIDNCGESVTVDAPPQRVVSLDQNSTEILLSLGLEDRLIGSASWTDPVRENLADANETVPRLADNAPTYLSLIHI